MTQRQLAEQIHLSDKVISKWENKESKPNLEDVTTLSQYFGVTLDYLISGKPTTQDAQVLFKQPTQEELIADAKEEFIKKCNVIIRNNNLYKYKDKIFPEKRCKDYLMTHIPIDYADIGIFHPLVIKETEPYEIGINLKALLSFKDYTLFEKIIALNLPLCDKYTVLDFFKKNRISEKDIHGFTDVRFYAFLSDQEILIKQSYERLILNLDERERERTDAFEDLKINHKEWLEEPYKKILNEALEKLERENPNYWKIVKLLIENGAFVQKMVGAHFESCSHESLQMDYADDIVVTELLYELACAKSVNKD